MDFNFNFDFGSKKKFLIIGGAVILVLIILLVVGSALGGGNNENEDIRVVKLPAEEQILKDSYRTSKQITDNLTYTPYFINNSNSDMSIINAFEPFKIQVDCMNIMTLGKTTMSEIVKSIDDANKITVDTIVEEIRAERQKAIDEEYEAEKKAAEEKGKSFNKEKRKASVDDLNYVTPYTYKVRFPDSNSDSENMYTDYNASYLLNPSQNNVVYLVLFKYNIPYVQFEFQTIEGIFNSDIRQEGDWKLTAIEAADCSYLVSEDSETRPAYVGEDLKCNAKNNIVISGNIQFSGDGFAWANTEIVTDKLHLANKNVETDSKDYSSYEWQSDEKYAYYIIKVATDMFFLSNNSDEYYQPIAKLTATFNRNTQICFNWRLEIDQNMNTINREYNVDLTSNHGTPISVNIKDYKVDTQDYNAMQENVDNWINENGTVEVGSQGYYLVDYKNNGKIIGKLDQGLFNVYSEVSINGEKYICVEKTDDGSGKYLKQDDYDKMPKETKESNAYIDKNAIIAKPNYLFIDEDDNAFAALDDINVVKLLDNDKNDYYVYSYDYNEEQGYSKVILIDKPVYEKLPEVYQMFYGLNEQEFQELTAASEDRNAIGMKEYIQKLHPSVK